MVHPDSDCEQLTEAEIWFSYRGRIGVGQYWGRFLLMVVLGFGLGAAIVSFSPESFGDVMGLLTLISIWPSTALAWKRLQDQGKHGALFFITLIPLVGFVFWLVVSLTEGTPGPNKYGQATGCRSLPRRGSRVAGKQLGEPRTAPMGSSDTRSNQMPSMTDKIERLERLARLLEQGHISDAEYSRLKNEVMADESGRGTQEPGIETSDGELAEPQHEPPASDASLGSGRGKLYKWLAVGIAVVLIGGAGIVLFNAARTGPTVQADIWAGYALFDQLYEAEDLLRGAPCEAADGLGVNEIEEGSEVTLHRNGLFSDPVIARSELSDGQVFYDPSAPPVHIQTYPEFFYCLLEVEFESVEVHLRSDYTIRFPNGDETKVAGDELLEGTGHSTADPAAESKREDLRDYP